MTVQIHGIKKLYEELDKFPEKLKRKVSFKVVRAGAGVVVKAARRKAPVRSDWFEGLKYKTKPGNLKKGIVAERARKQPRWIIRYVVGFKKSAWYGRLVETGHNIVSGGTLAGGKKRRSTKGKPFDRKGRPTTSGQGRVVGYVPPQPFLRPAFDNNIDKIVKAMENKLITELAKLR